MRRGMMRSMTNKPLPHPTAAAPLRATANVAEHRNVYCPHYNSCIGEAEQKGWDGFTCRACPHFNVAVSGPRAEDFTRHTPPEFV